MNLNSPRSFPWQIWLVLALLLALGVLLVPVVLGRSGTDNPYRLPDLRIVVRSTATPVPTVTPTAPTPSGRTATPTLVGLSAPQSLNSATPRPTNTPAPREDHLWLRRPVGPDANDTVARWYPYGSRADGTYPVHYGVEFVNPLGTPLQAVADGTIVVAGDDLHTVYGARDNFYGQLIVLRIARQLYGQPVYVLYGHVSEIDVSVGQQVTAGEIIGRVGQEGYAEGPHVHMEVRVGENDYGRTANPELWFESGASSGQVAGLLTAPDGSPAPEVRVLIARASSPNVAIYELTTYPDYAVNPDPAWGENWAAGGLAAGEYVAQVFYGNQLLIAPFSIAAGQTTWVEIRSRR